MANAPSFVEHALELLSSVGPVQAKRMFGGHGVYCRGVMFGLLDDDELFVKTDEVSRPTFVEAGCRMWVYPAAAMEETSYWRPPDEAHEDPEAMRPWAELGLEAALRKKAAKDAAARAKAERRRVKEQQEKQKEQEEQKRKQKQKLKAKAKVKVKRGAKKRGS